MDESLAPQNLKVTKKFTLPSVWTGSRDFRGPVAWLWDIFFAPGIRVFNLVV